ncbi:MAG: DUF177 domain-containing protein [Deltaproteobacteria bacterium]|nr:DUF177 domain-containing protein [Deltaproteobacteria bacterium]
MVVARGEARFGLELTCSRCLAPAAHRQKLPLEMVFRPPDQTREDEVQLGGDELEVIFYQGEEIDLGEAVRAEISLALPMAPLCREDCPGVCPRCGQAIEGPDHACGGPESDPRWVKLGEFKPAK